MKQFWIEYWIESILGKTQKLNWINLGIGHGYKGSGSPSELNKFNIARETEQGPIKIPQLLLLRCQLSGGWDTDLRSL